jgi:hypothetical protein
MSIINASDKFNRKREANQKNALLDFLYKMAELSGHNVNDLWIEVNNNGLTFYSAE